MLSHIATLDQLEAEAKKIDDFLNITCSDEIEEVVQRGNDLTVYIARTGKMVADSRFLQDKAVSESIISKLNINLSAMILKRLIESECKDVNYLCTWIERINRTCVHQLDWCRTIISKHKIEMQYMNG